MCVHLCTTVIANTLLLKAVTCFCFCLSLVFSTSVCNRGLLLAQFVVFIFSFLPYVLIQGLPGASGVEGPPGQKGDQVCDSSRHAHKAQLLNSDTSFNGGNHWIKGTFSGGLKARSMSAKAATGLCVLLIISQFILSLGMCYRGTRGLVGSLALRGFRGKEDSRV